MTDEKNNETSETPESQETGADPGAEKQTDQGGPKFTKGPDPLASVKETTSDLMASMEGKSVSMKVYVGTIIGIIVLMLLARCGG